MAVNENLVAKLRQILPDILRDTSVKLTYLYGSAAAGYMLPASDVNIALVLCTQNRPAMPSRERFQLEFTIESALEQQGVHKPEARVVDDLPLPLRGEVAMRGVRLFSNDEVARVEFETRTWKEYLDFEPMARMMRQAFFDDVQRHGLVRDKVEMVNPAKIHSLTYTLRQYLTHLKNLGAEGKDVILSDPYKRGATRYYLQVSIECCLDIGNHVIASEQFGVPTTHRETFEILKEAGLIPDDFALTMQQMASMRNRLVYLYAEIDDDVVFESTLTAPADCEQFVQLVLNYMQGS